MYVLLVHAHTMTELQQADANLCQKQEEKPPDSRHDGKLNHNIAISPPFVWTGSERYCKNSLSPVSFYLVFFLVDL